MKTHLKHNYDSNHKMCSKCQQKKPRTKEFFFACAKEKDGLSYICKECKKIIDKSCRTSNENYNIYQKSSSYVFSQLKYQAKKRNMPFEIDFAYYEQNLANKPCFYCGSEDTKHWVDRYQNDHSIGYTKENTVPCCELCNKMKMKLNPSVFTEHCKKITSFNS